MSTDKEKFTWEVTARQPAEDIFSVASLHDEIDQKRGGDRGPFTLYDLKRFSKLANRALNAADGDDPYAAEVFVEMGEGDYVYDMQTEPPRPVEPIGVLYGYINGYMVTVPTGASQEVFVANFEQFSEDITGPTHSYQVPLAVKGSNYGVRMVDAPAPIAQSRIEVSVQDMHPIAQEDREQDTIHSLLNIAETDIFKGDAIETDALEDSIVSLQNAGFIEKLDDMTTACNYYLQLCLHDMDPWKVKPDTVMERFVDGIGFDESGQRKKTLEWVSDELIVAGIDFLRDGAAVRSIIYARTEEGALYRSCVRDDNEHLVVYREENTDENDGGS